VVRFALGEVGVHEVEVAAERAVEECGPLGARAATADEGGTRRAAEVFDEAADRDDRLRVERTDRDAEGVEHADLELFEGRRAEFIERRASDEIGEILHFGHGYLHSSDVY